MPRQRRPRAHVRPSRVAQLDAPPRRDHRALRRWLQNPIPALVAIVMKISVFGLGYVGAVSCACLPELGHEVIGVDTNPSKVRMINDGQSPVVEEGINELIAAAVRAGNLCAVADVQTAVHGSEVSLISVATP